MIFKKLVANLTLRTITQNKKGTIQWLVGSLVAALAVSNPAVVDLLRLVAGALVESLPPEPPGPRR